MEYRELVQHLSFKKLDTLKEAVAITRDFAVAKRLETEADVNLTSSVSKKTHQVFSIHEAGGGAKQEQAECRHFKKTGKCKYGNKCRFKHVKKADIAPVKVTKKPSEKFEGECFHCGKKGHRRRDCHRKQREDLEANGQAIQQDSQVFTMSQLKRSHRKKQAVAPLPDSDSSEDEANAQIFSIFQWRRSYLISRPTVHVV